MLQLADRWCDEKIARNGAKCKNYTIFAPLNSLNNPKWKNKRKREKQREKSSFSAADRSYDLFIFLPPSLKRVKKNWGSDYSQGLKGMVVNKSRPLDSSFFKCRLCWLCWGHLTNQRWGKAWGEIGSCCCGNIRFVLVFELRLDTFFYPIFLRADTEWWKTENLPRSKTRAQRNSALSCFTRRSWERRNF